ncbi:acyl-CoA dehydrogenase family protein [Spirillospora sp. CA-255316]
MDFTWDPVLAELSERATEVAHEAARVHGSSSDAWMNGFSKEFSRELGRLGWIGMSWPTEVGGGGLSPLSRLIVSQAMLEAGAPVAASWFADRQIGPSLIGHGSADQRTRFLPGILSGDTTWCIGMSEPNAGSDVSALRTRATLRGGRWVVNGQKIWTSFAGEADYCYLICRTGPHTTGHHGISELIVPMDTEGVTVRPIRDLAGRTHFCEVFFDDVAVPVENLVGVEGAAFSQTMRQLEHERGGIDRLFSNRGLYLDARARADRTRPEIRAELAALETAYHTGRLMVIREALRQGPAGFSAVTKTFCTTHEQRVARFAWQTMGAEGIVWNELVRGLAYSPSYSIMGGTNEILRNIIAERMLQLPREPKAAR